MTVPARTRIRDEVDRERRRISRENADPADPSSVHARSSRVVGHLRAWLSRQNSASPMLEALRHRVVASYREPPSNEWGEVELAALASAPELASIAFAYPRIIDRFLKKMDFAIPFHETDWRRGPYGLLEPRYDLPAVPLEEIEIFLVPGVAFGRRGERLGRGAGFYDRLLALAPKALRIGICFDFQLIGEEIPQEPWDERMDVIVTESGVIEVGERP